MTEDSRRRGRHRQQPGLLRRRLSSNRDARPCRRASTMSSPVKMLSARRDVMVYDPQKRLIAHHVPSHRPARPSSTKPRAGERPSRCARSTTRTPVTGACARSSTWRGRLRAASWARPLVGMGQGDHRGRCRKPGCPALCSAASRSCGEWPARLRRRITPRLARSCARSEHVGRCATPHLAHVPSLARRDRQLARTFNETDTRLPLPGHHRDRSRRGEPAARGPPEEQSRAFARRSPRSRRSTSPPGEVTPDVLGNVVDAVNYVDEIATLLADVRHAALRVAGSANDMLGASDQMATARESGPRGHPRQPRCETMVASPCSSSPPRASARERRRPDSRRATRGGRPSGTAWPAF